MVTICPYFLLVLPIGIGGLYAGEAWKRKRTDNQRICTSLVIMWSIWTIVGLIYAVMLIPPPPPPGEPTIFPGPVITFSIAVYYIFLPALAVWILMMLDLRAYALKTKHISQTASQSES